MCEIKWIIIIINYLYTINTGKNRSGGGRTLRWRSGKEEEEKVEEEDTHLQLRQSFIVWLYVRSTKF